ncbi:MAG TPA: hypothetical protein VFC94_04695 [Bacteroidaceae bacterium]|nr:hypothetical protein [Bacteroidaceae bacterium]
MAIIALIFLLRIKTVENREMLELFEIEKEEMENEYSGFAIQYDELKVQITNDSLIKQLEKEKNRTQQLLEELRQTKSTNASEITRLKKELTTIRTIMKGYLAQIDSLDRINKELSKENIQVQQKYKEASKTIDNLTIEKKLAEEKVTLASRLDATAITVTPRNKRGRTEKKVKDITMFVIEFTIVKNLTAPSGEKNLFVRIAKPDNEVLTKSADNTFLYENKNLEYSIKKYIEYTGEEQQITLYWNVEEFLYAGKYNVYIFADGIMIGEQSFYLE